MLNKCVKLFFILFFLFGSVCLTANLAYADDNTNNAAAEEAETQKEQDNKTCNIEAIREEYFGHTERTSGRKHRHQQHMNSCHYHPLSLSLTNVPVATAWMALFRS